jgi:alpha-L-fucosidase
MRRCWIILVVLGTFRGVSFATEPPAPYGPVPTTRQLQLEEMRSYAFTHFSVNTFTDREWGYGDEAESVFNPTDFDPDQIVRSVKAAGLTGLILTAKHHDGFCLWPSKFTKHSVKYSSWKNGKGDVVRDMAAACKRGGIKFGLYLSPWDRNNADYAGPAYVTYYKNQVRELLTNYGPIFEMWFDGANGGDGFYGGKRDTRKIPANYYDWKGVVELIRELQPECAVWCAEWKDGKTFKFNDIIWGGSESGTVPDPCWETASSKVGHPNGGVRGGDLWLPSEADVSIRPGWFYHASEDNKVKTPREIMDIYFQSVGRGANLILNTPPDRRGQLQANDVKSLAGFGKLMADTFGKNLAESATAKASNVRGGDDQFSAKQLLETKPTCKPGGYWSTDDSVTTPNVTLEFKQPVTFDIVRLREHLPLGQRVDDWALDAWQDGAWLEFAKGTAIGACRLLRTKQPITTEKVRLRITKSPVCPAISEFALFIAPKDAAASAAEK